MKFLVLIFAVFACSSVLLSSSDALEIGYYNKVCPLAEAIVSATVFKHFLQNRTVPAALIRLHFHDCFVRGCDGSLLLDVTPGGQVVEKEALPNKGSVRGFEIIDEAKDAITAVCGNVVSCADVLALSARDSFFLTSGLYYQLPTGRFDGRTSLASEAIPNLPAFTLTAAELKANFARKKLNTNDLIVLSGGHTLGRATCAAFTHRLYNFQNTSRPDPTLSQDYLRILRGICPQSGNPSPRVQLDKGTEFIFDNSYYAEIVKNNGLLQTDQELLFDQETSATIRSFAKDNLSFLKQFSQSMINMGAIEVKTAKDGEIRRKCNVPNSGRISSHATE
ncbi:hypothetical protein SELMODRAFT_182951 [Selaginella moellendorffii]|uniref:Peroxidase n=1 Tax=Selaginella moellendorffii TaxID=88036 RepID=D8SV34_SELML|nr:peroxidase 5 [Selaginella moellendorffii]EFJ11802.1 hypothetical protein SELMODRAFT_182951 [Selaginella moellendorffii]|eukprot:XP_002987226.1 peroxidase 5 [Selaginella moellendorffii]